MASPAIIFFDEFDALVPRRGMGYADQGVSERVISQLLTEMDGIIGLENIVVIGATNRPDILDPAVLRPGRFDKLIYVPSPDEKARLEIFRVYTKNMPLTGEVSIEALASLTKGYSGADIEAVCREAGLNALRKNINTKEVSMEDFREALARIGSSITPEMEKFYESFGATYRRQIEKTLVPPPIA
jgi:transitional endoplasmic reticulum ATPase